MMNKSIRLLILLGLLTVMVMSGYALAATPTSSQVTVESLFGTKGLQNKINWKTGIINICKEFQWVTKPTYLNCKKFATQHQLLAAPLPKRIVPSKKATQEQLSVLIKRAGNVGLSRSSAPEQGDQQDFSTTQRPPTARLLNTGGPSIADSTTIPQRQFGSLDFTPVSQNTINQDFFRNIHLAQSLPNTFYQNEIYIVEGDVTNISATDAFIFLCKQGTGCSDSINFLEKTNGTHFSIPVFFPDPGNYQLGALPGRAGESKVVSISVLPQEAPTQGGVETPAGLSRNYSEGKTTFSWSGLASNAPAQLTFFQQSKRVDFYFRKTPNSFTPPSSYFKEFVRGPMHWFVTSGGKNSEMKNEVATVQDFRKVNTSDISVSSMQEVFSQPGTLHFVGRSVRNVSKKAAVTLPNGQVQEIFFTDTDLGPGGNIDLSINLPESGTYIFELNNPEGAAVVNTPIYVGNVLPIIPDFFALNPSKLSLAPVDDLTAARNRMVQLINSDRALHGLPGVVLDGPLDSVAQAHSENMKAQHFFGHKDPQGRSPDDRRRTAGIPTGIRENLGKSSTLELIQAGLMRSPVHRDAIIDPRMKRVGIGIAKDAEGYVLVTQNYSGDTIVSSMLESVRSELMTNAQLYRRQKSLDALSDNGILRNVAINWASRMSSKDFFGLTDPNGDTLANLIRAEHIITSVKIHLTKTSDVELLSDELFKQASIKDGTLHTIGIGLSTNPLGDIYMTTLYTP